MKLHINGPLDLKLNVPAANVDYIKCKECHKDILHSGSCDHVISAIISPDDNLTDKLHQHVTVDIERLRDLGKSVRTLQLENKELTEENKKLKDRNTVLENTLSGLAAHLHFEMKGTPVTK